MSAMGYFLDLSGECASVREVELLVPMNYFLHLSSECASVGEIERLIRQYPGKFDVSIFFESICQDILNINLEIHDLHRGLGVGGVERIEELESQRDTKLDWVCNAIYEERKEVI